MKILAAYILSVCCTFALWALARTFGLESGVTTAVAALVISGGFYLIFKAAYDR